jgi:hypothetical protein
MNVCYQIFILLIILFIAYYCMKKKNRFDIKQQHLFLYNEHIIYETRKFLSYYLFDKELDR